MIISNIHIDENKLDKQAKLCRRNLKNKRVKICNTCPFEDILKATYPEMIELFIEKHKANIETP